MISAAMAVQDDSGVTRSCSSLPVENGITFSSGLHSMNNIQQQDQFSSGIDYAPKVRKQYTITKQRERWTEEEHKKFLEALKLYGRAWRRIEEHVGTKTAVQIRSHAQKFFSKVARDPNGSNRVSMEFIEIPPPRPKRKPAHPYPRKFVQPPNTKACSVRWPVGSESPKSINFDQENQSPKSVFSAIGSDALGSSDSDAPNGSPSPISSSAFAHNRALVPTRPKILAEGDGVGTPLEPKVAADIDEQPLQSCEPVTRESVLTEDAYTSSKRTLKLFGSTVPINDSSRPSSPITAACEPDSDTVQLTWNFLQVESLHEKVNCGRNDASHGGNGAVYHMHLQDGNSSSMESCHAVYVPFWSVYQGTPLLSPQKQEMKDENSDANLGEVDHKEGQKEVSCAESVYDSQKGEKSEAETQSRLAFRIMRSENSAFSEVVSRSKKCNQGFLPYKRSRCLTEGDTEASVVTGEEREEKLVRLSL